MIPPVLLILFDARVMGSIDILVFTLEVEFTIGSVEALFVVLWVTMERNSTVEFRGDICWIVLIFVCIIAAPVSSIRSAISSVVTTSISAVTSIIVCWIRVTVDLMESESNFSLMCTFKGVGNIIIFSIIKIVNMEDVFVSEMIKFSGWSWQGSSEVLFGPRNTVLSISVLSWIKVEFYWLSCPQILLESLFVGNDRKLILFINTRRSKDWIRLALNHGLFTLHLGILSLGNFGFLDYCAS